MMRTTRHLLPAGAAAGRSQRYSGVAASPLTRAKAPHTGLLRRRAAPTAATHAHLVVASTCARWHSTLAMASAAPVAATAAAPAQDGRVGLIGAAAAASLSPLDWSLLRWQHQLKLDLPERPKQTGFRVFAILLYKPKPRVHSNRPNDVSVTHPYDHHNYVEGTNEQLAYITGTNTEPCFIGSSICAERSAILQMRMKHYESIERLYITADSDAIITPGLLCRELMTEFLSFDTPIVLASTNAKLEHGFDVQVASLRTLWPYPHLYLNVPGSELQTFAQQYHATGEQFTATYAENAAWVALYREVVKTTEKDLRPGLHPLRYAAGVLFADGSTTCVAMTKLLEYGWSLDPVVKLVSYLETQRALGNQPILVLQADQYGNLHAMSAPARSHLSEYGYDPVVIFHTRDGKLVQVRAKALAPDVPDAIEDVLPTTVRQSVASHTTTTEADAAPTADCCSHAH